MKRKGFNLIEMLIAGAIIGLVFLLTAPLVKSFGMVNERIRVQNEVDREFAVVSKFIKKQVRSGRMDRSEDTIKDKDGTNVNGYSALFSFDGEVTTEQIINNSVDLIFDDLKITSDDANILFIETPDESNSKYAFFIFRKGNLIYYELSESDTAYNSKNEEVLMENVSSASFELSSEGVVTFSIDLDVGEFEGKIKDSIRESAVSRIDLNI